MKRGNLLKAQHGFMLRLLISPCKGTINWGILVARVGGSGDPRQSSYLSQISQIIFAEKKLSCGEILGNFFEKFWEMLRNFWNDLRRGCVT